MALNVNAYDQRLSIIVSVVFSFRIRMCRIILNEFVLDACSIVKVKMSSITVLNEMSDAPVDSRWPINRVNAR